MGKANTHLVDAVIRLENKMEKQRQIEAHIASLPPGTTFIYVDPDED